MAGVVLCFALVRTGSELRRSHEKERLIRSVVRQYSLQIATLDWNEDGADLIKPWPNDFLLLEKWLALQVSRNNPPLEIRRHLFEMQKLQPQLSPSMQTSLARWYETLERWSREPRPIPIEGQDALRRGRQKYFEARGYAEIGRAYDAAVLFLWSASWLVKAVETGRQDFEYPEALYLLGDIYMTLRHSLPEGFHGEQLLSVCSDLYPSSIWASRANAAQHLGGG
jgi:hypothetical protein